MLSPHRAEAITVIIPNPVPIFPQPPFPPPK